MADEPNTPEGGQNDAGDGDYTPPATQADLDRIIGERLSRERAKFADYDDLQQKASLYDTVAEAAKTDVERLEDRASSAEGKIGPLEAENLRLKVALAKGLPANLIGRLQGSTQEEIEKDADELLGLVAPAQRTPDLRAAAGQRPVASQGSDADAWIRGMARGN